MLRNRKYRLQIFNFLLWTWFMSETQVYLNVFLYKNDTLQSYVLPIGV